MKVWKQLSIFQMKCVVLVLAWRPLGCAVKMSGGGEGLCNQVASLLRCKMQLSARIRRICIPIFFFPKMAKLRLLCFMGIDSTVVMS